MLSFLPLYPCKELFDEKLYTNSANSFQAFVVRAVAAMIQEDLDLQNHFQKQVNAIVKLKTFLSTGKFLSLFFWFIFIVTMSSQKHEPETFTSML